MVLMGRYLRDFGNSDLMGSMKKILYIVIAIAIITGVAWLIVTPGKPSKHDDFAKCINDTGKVIFWGAFWCPHCQAQKALFGKAAQYLPYKECSTPDGRGQLQECQDAGINTYPTWDFTSTTATTTDRVTGEMSLEELAERTSCVLPE